MLFAKTLYGFGFPDTTRPAPRVLRGTTNYGITRCRCRVSQIFPRMRIIRIRHKKCNIPVSCHCERSEAISLWWPTRLLSRGTRDFTPRNDSGHGFYENNSESALHHLSSHRVRRILRDYPSRDEMPFYDGGSTRCESYREVKLHIQDFNEVKAVYVSSRFFSSVLISRRSNLPTFDFGSMSRNSIYCGIL